MTFSWERHVDACLHHSMIFLSSNPKRDILSTGTCRDTLYASSFRGIQGTYSKFIGRTASTQGIQISVPRSFSSGLLGGRWPLTISSTSSGGVLLTSISPQPYRGLWEASHMRPSWDASDSSTEPDGSVPDRYQNSLRHFRSLRNYF